MTESTTEELMKQAAEMRTAAQIDHEIALLQEEKRSLWPKQVAVVLELNGQETSLTEIAEDLEFDNAEESKFEKSCTELTAVLEVEKDGSAWMISIGGASLDHRISVN
jgi:hypothetical protein